MEHGILPVLLLVCVAGASLGSDLPMWHNT